MEAKSEKSLKRKPSLKDVAKLAGVSISAASKILNKTQNPFSFGEETKAKVQEAAKKLGYKPNSFARAMLTGKTGNIAVVVNDFARFRGINSFILSALSDEVQANEMKMILYNNRDVTDGEPLRIFDEVCVDGLISLDINQEAFTEAVKNSGIPHVFMNSVEEPLSCVTLDDRKGAFDAVSHLTGLGHEKIAFLSSNERHYSALRRLEGYEDALKARGLAYRRVVHSDDPEGGTECMEALFKGPDSPTAVFLYSDESMIAALTWLQARGLMVPRDVSLFGCNDSHYIKCVFPKLSSVKLPINEMAAKGFEMLLKAIETGEAQPSVVLKEALALRDSCAAPAIEQRRNS